MFLRYLKMLSLLQTYSIAVSCNFILFYSPNWDAVRQICNYESSFEMFGIPNFYLNITIKTFKIWSLHTKYLGKITRFFTRVRTQFGYCRPKQVVMAEIASFDPGPMAQIEIAPVKRPKDFRFCVFFSLLIFLYFVFSHHNSDNSLRVSPIPPFCSKARKAI